MNAPQFVVRSMRKEDEAFIYATWLRSLYYGNTWFSEVDKEAFFENYPRVIEALLNSSDVRVVTLSEDDNVVVGYACYDLVRLHWVYTKKAWRRLGIAKMLVPKGVTTCTHLTKVGKLVKPKEWKFNPFL